MKKAYQYYAEQLAEIRQKGLLKSERIIEGRQGAVE